MIPTPRFSIIYHGPCQTHKVHRLSEYTEYKFKIQACNEAGEGPLSGIYTFTTTRTPPPTLKGKYYKPDNEGCINMSSNSSYIKISSTVYFKC